MEELIVFAAISLWILLPKYFRYRQEMARAQASQVQQTVQQEEVRQLKERLENLESLICRLDWEINYQLEKSLSSGHLITTSRYAGNSQMPTTFMNVASALESRYQILQELGRGGMGIVFQAYDRELKEQVALKILSPLLNNKDALERLKREVSAARRITHTNVIRIHDIFETGGLHYVSMEYFHGTSLKDWIRQHHPVSPQQAYRIAKQICDGLEAAHQQGVIHRDLKSQNIIVSPTHQVKIIDFGLAHAAHLEGLTATGLIMGTPEYMAPEQVAGKKVDERADIYSLGIVLYELYTGGVPFTGDSAIAVGFKQMKENPPPPRSLNQNISPQIERIILKCLEKDPSRRYSSVGELKQELETVATMAPYQEESMTKFREPISEKVK